MKNPSNSTFLYNHTAVKNADYNVWMAFPGPKSFALSSLGYMWMYKTIDERPDINIEMLFSDTENPKLKNADMIGFSFTFDMDFLTIFSMLEKHNIPLMASDRDEKFPLIFAGGPVVTANPEPYKDFFDFFIIGDGEELNLQVVNICKNNSNKNKDELLKILSEIEGIYVPALNPNSVNKITKKLSECIYTPIISNESFFKNTFIVEIERGCANRCGFCLASYLNLPIRFIPYEKIIEVIELGLKYTDKIALLGAQLTAHPQFGKICKYIYDKIQHGEKIQMSVSSMRVDSFTPEIVKTLVAAGQKNTTLAIEAGSERLRKIINKNLTEDQIFNAVEVAKANGLKGFKFYGMIGLPTETTEDLDEMIRLARKLKEKFKGFDISFGFSSFVPKPNTPFQWCGREQTKSLEKKADYIKRELHKLGIKSQFSSHKWDYYQAVLSRGDGSFTEYLIDVYKKGGNLGAFKSAAKNLIDTDYYACQTYNFEQKLPWDFINMKPGKEFLINENKRLLN